MDMSYGKRVSKARMGDQVGFSFVLDLRPRVVLRVSRSVLLALLYGDVAQLRDEPRHIHNRSMFSLAHTYANPSDRRISQDTNHFTLAQRHPVTIIRNTKCTLPRVRMRSARKINMRMASTPSTMCRNTGLRDEPGVRMFAKRPSSPDGAAAVGDSSMLDMGVR